MALREGQTFASVLREIPGAFVQAGRGGHSWLMSTHGPVTLSGAGMTGGDAMDGARGAKRGCHPRVYLDRFQVFSGREGEPLFDLGSISPDRIMAMEYYTSVAQVPAMYAGTNDACGVLVIWLRRSFEAKP